MSSPIASFYVAGVQFHELKSIHDKLEVGSILQMVAEPTNKYDPNAVRLEFNNFMIGYVPRKYSAMIAGYMAITELTCLVASKDMSKKAWEQLAVDIIEETNYES